MSIAEFVITDIPLHESLSWENQPADTPIADIEPLEIDKAKMRLLLPGEGEVSGTSPSINYLVSERFMCCSALITLSNAKDFTLAHVEPIDRLHKKMRATQRSPDQALLIYGTRSEPPYEILNLLSHRGTNQRVLRVETGDAPFGVVLDVEAGQVSVVRQAPGRSILQYHPFA